MGMIFLALLILSLHDEDLWYDSELKSIIDEIFDVGNRKDSAYCMGLCKIALAVIPHEKKDLRNKLQLILRNCLAQNPVNANTEDIYYKIFDRRKGEVMPIESANSAMKTAAKLGGLAHGDPKKSEEAIELYLHALSCLNITQYKYDWAEVMIARARIVMHLGDVYSDLARGRSKDVTDIDQAIMNYRIALAVFSREMSPIDWATATERLEAAYAIRVVQ